MPPRTVAVVTLFSGTWNGQEFYSCPWSCIRSRRWEVCLGAEGLVPQKL